MHSTLQRLNHISSTATTYVLILLSLISITSYLTLPPVAPGKLEIRDLIVQRGRLRRWGAKEEDLASLRFDLKTDLEPLLNSYNTKQLFLYLTASYTDSLDAQDHEVVLWDRIITRGDIRDLRSVNKSKSSKSKSTKSKRSRAGRGRVWVEEGKNKYTWKMPSGSFKGVQNANLTVYYSLMPYVGLLSSGVAATATSAIHVPNVA
ncbi:putative signal peptidase [Kockovaella imperatae]|uniref:Signal peptidase subunit 3 n=1 Tax=Kockovaella imperatae TaxID=4999 RepID=A0A1Y1UGW3_9TREE|nr:putative signal peptidase [Kockovaella imperatae]ORX37209.1 putative signal peptidase [Kockovaella imperatae]